MCSFMGSSQSRVDNCRPIKVIKSRTLIETPRGFKTYKELDRNVYQPLGYQIREESFIPALDYIQQPVCSKVRS